MEPTIYITNKSTSTVVLVTTETANIALCYPSEYEKSTTAEIKAYENRYKPAPPAIPEPEPTPAPETTSTKK